MHSDSLHASNAPVGHCRRREGPVWTGGNGLGWKCRRWGRDEGMSTSHFGGLWCKAPEKGETWRQNENKTRSLQTLKPNRAEVPRREITQYFRLISIFVLSQGPLEFQMGQKGAWPKHPKNVSYYRVFSSLCRAGKF